MNHRTRGVPAPAVAQGLMSSARLGLVWMLLLTITALLSACVTPQPALDERTEAALSTMGVAEALSRPDALPQTVRWGGTIVQVDNRSDGHSVVEIVARPLAGSGRPLSGDSSSGRFRAEFRTFLDPALYTEGRDLTVVGTVTTLVDGKIGDMDYRFPLLEVDKSTYWAVQQELPPRYPYSYPHYHRDWYDDWPFYRRRPGTSGYLILSN